jgi:hypothetical protein
VGSIPIARSIQEFKMQEVSDLKESVEIYTDSNSIVDYINRLIDENESLKQEIIKLKWMATAQD